MEQNPSRRDVLQTLGAVPIAAGIRRLFGEFYNSAIFDFAGAAQ